MAKRPTTGKRLRFEIFKRDHFTCQYCGAQPPAVVLVCDHVTPVAEGGLSTMDNLVAACEACNQGKAAKRVQEAGIRPDADLLYLETQQEIAEIRRYRSALLDREIELQELTDDLVAVWLDRSGYAHYPPTETIRNLVRRYPPAVVGDAVVLVAGKVRAGAIVRHSTSYEPYLWAVARNMAQKRGEE